MHALNMNILLEALLLVIALSIDAFVASFAYGTNKIKIPWKSAALITLICSFLLGMALFLGNSVSSFIPPWITKGLCFSALFLLGLLKLFDSTIKSWLKKSTYSTQAISFKFLDFQFFLKVCIDSTEADKDHSHILSPSEACSLAIALSLDGLAAGFSTGLLATHSLDILLLSLIVNGIAILLGCFLGNRFAQKTNYDISWLSGVLLIVLAFLKL
ncbi:sporulation membrane protein YtaF [Sporanaerobium hydrogeniformans]|uniref:Sporulation membrane protein YtaF n=1 Tax=Sporanaerobium hydrogeniformans TaxID=3072179 RepID=A0AC61DGS0_9FIRM|nr:sporulation membrane protein YtaF [Sporanaerobium hydrogeniformans]PHV71567.1 sporulation membrane protein YtaF [Sporanaerobium hydrogeniformans]